MRRLEEDKINNWDSLVLILLPTHCALSFVHWLIEWVETNEEEPIQRLQVVHHLVWCSHHLGGMALRTLNEMQT